MANKNLFAAPSTKITATYRTHPATPVADTVNAAGGKAYEMTAHHALAQIAATNCFNGTYYADASTNLQLAKNAVAQLKNDPEFIAKVAVYSRGKAYMKDMPAFLVAVLATLDSKLFRKVFPIVIDNAKMLRNFIQIARSGQAGKKINLSSHAVKGVIREWFEEHNSNFIFRGSIGNDPSMKDILKLCRPRPNTEEKAALFAYLEGATFNEESKEFIVKNKDGSIKYRNKYSNLPAIVREYEEFKKTRTGEIPKVDFRMLDSFLSKEDARKMWAEQARNAGWTMTRMNLNNFVKYGVFEDSSLTNIVANRLCDREQVLKAKVYPYQLMMAYNATTGNNVPVEVRQGLRSAMEIALENIPEVKGKIYICVDTSGSMRNAVTGNRGSATSAARCIDVAALFGAAFLKKNKFAEIIPFDTKVHKAEFNPDDSVLTTAAVLAKFGGGGTDCACAVKHLNTINAKADAIIFVSDNESWVDQGGYSRGTGLMNEWNIFKKTNQNAKLVCIDLTPRSNGQVKENKDILQVGGFGDQVFDVVSSFIEHGFSNNHWVEMINAVELRNSKQIDVELTPQEVIVETEEVEG